MVEKEGTNLCTGVSEEALLSVINTLKPGKLDPPYRVCTNYPADQEETALSQTALSASTTLFHSFRTLSPDTTHSGHIIITDLSCFVEIKYLVQLEGKDMM